MTADILGQKLHTRCHTLLVQLYRRGKLQREKVGRSYKQIGNGYGFPFDQPLLHFGQRVFELNRTLPELLKHLPQDKTRRPIRKLAKQLYKIGQDQEILRAVKELQWRSEIFDELRTAMRIASENENNGLNDDGIQESMTTIRQEVERFRNDFNSKMAKNVLCQKIVQQIDKYAEKLFADPIEVNTSKGKVFIYPQRTNKISWSSSFVAYESYRQTFNLFQVNPKACS